MKEETDQQESPVNDTIESVINLGKSIAGKDKLTDEQIEAIRADYWKCPKCGAVNYLNVFVCWKCEASRPKNFEHPGLEDLKKDLAKENKSGLFWTGLAFFICTGGVLLRGYFYDSHDDTFPDSFTMFFAAFFAILGVILILAWLIRKVPAK